MLKRLKWFGGFMLLLLMLPSLAYGHANMERSSPLEDAVLTIETILNTPSISNTLGTPTPEQHQHLETAVATAHDHSHHDTGVHIGEWRTPVYHLLRILEVLAVMCLSGFLIFRYGIWGYARSYTSFLFSRENELKLYLLVGAVFAVSGVLHVWMLAEQLSGLGSESIISVAGKLLTSTLIGSVSWIRLALAGLLIVVTYTSKRESIGTLYMKAIITLILIITYPLTGHAYGSESGVLYAVMSHTLHILTAAIGLGGLVGIWSATCKLDYYEATYFNVNNLIQRFSAIALPAILIVSISGFVLAYMRLKSFYALVQTEYGLWVLSKTVLLLLIVVIGTFHRLVLMPMMRKTADTKPEDYLNVLKKFVWGVRLEIMLAVAVIACAGMLSTTTLPAKVTVTEPVYWHVMGDKAHMSMRISFDEKNAQAFRLDVWLPTGMGAPVDVNVTARKAESDASLVIPFNYRTGGPDPYGYEGFDKYTYDVNGNTLPEKGEWSLSILIKDRKGQTHPYDKIIRVP
ncbi:copper resistance D family protein [Paenibacillus sp. FSL H7-0331]|uniref:copper resistance D family protein n=1 Tax=Paenibacillus sp. FSL H7-0331 TaxID=1920421 RepID=UPI00096EAC73|nr:CopD family protein [Paenibacillus sp. FSL H7-0331]OME99264.1 hypothetical protein BK127_38905 [Paenibacillus sp. FSL H7-0331]